MSTLPLFDSPALPPIARRSDPVSSHIAAATVTKSGSRESNCRKVLLLVKDYPGRTSKELAALTWEFDRYEVARRLADLAEQGKVRRVGVEPGKRKQILWEATT